MQKILGQFSLLLMAAFILVSCGNADYKRSNSGMMYKIFKAGGKDEIKPGAFLKVHYRALLNDSVLFTTYDRLPAYGRYDTTAGEVHDFLDFLPGMRVGDSAVYIRSVDTMMKKGFLMYNNVFKPGGTIKGYVVVLGTYADEAAMKADQDKETEKETQREIAALEQYLKGQKIEGLIKTEKGVFLKVESEGTGEPIAAGSTVVVNYTGMLKDGKKFDSNVDSAFNHVQPFEFTVGTGSVIKGWDEAITRFRKGGKGRVYVPAMLGYGGQAQGENLPAFSDLVFDIEVVDVKPATVLPPGPIVPEANH